jgi:hypothetical protein
MNKNLLIGITISVINLLFYATFLDLLFHFGIFQKLFGFNLLGFFGEACTSIGVGAIIIAISLEVVSYRIIRRGGHRSEENKK